MKKQGKQRPEIPQKSEIERAIVAYYDSMSEEDQEQERAWGELAERNFPE